MACLARMGVLVCLVAWTCLAAGLLGGEATPKEAPSQTGNAGTDEEQAGSAYVDRNFGYSFVPPAGFVGDSTKVPRPDGSIQLTQFVSRTKNAWLRIRYSQAKRAFTKAELLEGLRVEASGWRQGAKVGSAELRQVAGRPTAVCEVRCEADERALVRYQAAIQSQPDEVFLVIFQAEERTMPDAQAVFERVLQTFDIPRSVLTQKSLEEGFRQGIKWLLRVSSRDWSSVLAEESYWRFENKGKPLGFIRVYEKAVVQKGTPGAEIRERAWFFADDWSYRDVQNKMFLSLDLRTETWENLAQSRADVDGKVRMVHDLHKSLRGDEKMLSRFTERPGDLGLASDSLDVPKTYISMALLRLFPRLVDLTKPRTYAFTAYDIESRELMVRVMKVLGQTQSAGIRASGPVFKIEIYNGILPPATDVYTDRKGRILKTVSGELVMIACDRKRIDSIFKTQMAQADELYNRSMAQQQEALIEQLRKAAALEGRKRSRKR